MGFFKTLKRIKWRNIFGLMILVALILFIVTAASWLNRAIEGDCVEKNGIKVCFWTDKDVMAVGGSNTVHFRIRNVGQSTRSASVGVGVSPNLVNLTPSFHHVDAIAPGEAVERQFGLRAKDERGRFKVGFDIDADTKPDKELYLTVE